jgi:hypothetical protein
MNIQTDLSGKYTLISKDFIYFGSKEERLPKELIPIAKYSNGSWIGQARKSNANNPYRTKFLKWVNKLPYRKKAVLGTPMDNPYIGKLNVDQTSSLIACGDVNKL